MPIDDVQRTVGGGVTVSTSDGTLYVSNSFQSSKSNSSKKKKAIITFVPRQSAFDINNENSVANEFRGFFSLFWISIFIFTVRTYIRSIETNGHALNLAFATMFSQHAVTLALSDGVLVGFTSIFCVVFAKLIANGWIKYYWTGVLIQHIVQTTVLAVAIGWTFNRHWPWVQSGFLTLHTLVMIMKMHSYMSVNGYLQHVSKQSKQLLSQLRKATEEEGGWDNAIRAAKERRAELDAASSLDPRDAALGQSNSESSTPAIGTPPIPIADGVQTSYVDPLTANALRKRLTRMSDANGAVNADAQQVVESLKDPISATFPTPATPHPLVDHPNSNISTLATELSELQGELVSSGPLYVSWPNNVTWKNFATYMLIPTLVYELEYPRTNKIRPLYIFEKTVATFGTFVLLYTVTESFILPLTEQGQARGQGFFRSLLDLALPFMMAYLLLFYIIFECICNGFAELSYFADRQFYEDWWNSTTQAEFSRKWNKPVHSFLLRHVYASTMTSYKLSRQSAMFVTFLLSACVHELVMVVVTKKFRFYLFALQLIQIPLIAVNSIPFFKRNKILGNLMFWLGLYAGFPLLCVAYVAY